MNEEFEQSVQLNVGFVMYQIKHPAHEPVM